MAKDTKAHADDAKAADKPMSPEEHFAAVRFHLNGLMEANGENTATGMVLRQSIVPHLDALDVWKEKKSA